MFNDVMISTDGNIIRATLKDSSEVFYITWAGNGILNVTQWTEFSRIQNARFSTIPAHEVNGATFS